jgi:DNA-3-methyladenine glycosylase
MNACHAGIAPLTMPTTSSPILAPAFFDRPADVVARDLVGRTLVRRLRGKRIALTVSETEAYLGPHDLACHAARGRTLRTEVMYGPAGTLYIYFIYGLYWMLNIVTGPVGYPAAVLIRGAGHLTGPGKLTRALAIDGALNGEQAEENSGLWFEAGEGRPPVSTTRRIGVAYAGPRWSARKLRFVLRS